MEKKALRKVPTYAGPIHDVAWNPNGKDFIAISGFMPAYSILYDSSALPKYEFGKHHRNTIKWSPFSRLVCLAGFGNLSGEIDVWDMSCLQKIAHFKSNTAVSCTWSPDGRRLMTGVLNPRLRVDNDYKIFKYNGELINSIDFSHTELYEVLWRPTVCEDRPITPQKKLVVEPEKKVFRAKGSSSFADQLKAERGEKNEGGRILEPTEKFGNPANDDDEEKDEPKKKKRVRKRGKKHQQDDDGDEETKEYE